MNNSVFGETQENLRKRVPVELITDAGILRKRVAKPNFCRGNPITDSDIYTVHCGNSYTEPTHLYGLFRARLVKDAHV